ncbi:MAG: hypothetical protein R3200_03610 [Xanthomonadales bacterium]|nr:hypothetical protein [Xanthomonadales bacterium]
MKRMKYGSRALRLFRAAAFAMISVGGLATGLGLTTYTVSKANEMMFGPVPIAQAASAPEQCLLD